MGPRENARRQACRLGPRRSEAVYGSRRKRLGGNRDIRPQGKLASGLTRLQDMAGEWLLSQDAKSADAGGDDAGVGDIGCDRPV